MAIRRRCLAPLPFMTGFYVAAGFTFQQILFVSADLQSAMLCVTEFMQSADCRRRRSSPSGSKNHRATLYCRQADSAAACFCVSVRLTLVFQRGYLLCSGVICNPRERNSVIALDCMSHAWRARGEPSAELPAARARRTAADNKPASTCCGLQISVNVQTSQCVPQSPFPMPD